MWRLSLDSPRVHEPVTLPIEVDVESVVEGMDPASDLSVLALSDGFFWVVEVWLRSSRALDRDTVSCKVVLVMSIDGLEVVISLE